MSGIAGTLVPVVERVLGTRLPVAVRAWDGSVYGDPSTTPTLVLRNPRSVRHLLWAPSELGMARAYVSGDLDLDGDIYAFFHLLADAFGTGRTVSPADAAVIGKTAMQLGVIGPRPPIPPEEAQQNGRLHSLRRDRQAISHHYDVGNDFYDLILGPSLVYSCAYWARPEDPSYTLVDAQRDKLDLVCRKLDLQPGQRLLDVGCGWGSMALHAAQHYDVDVVGVTLSVEQADRARIRVKEAGLEDRIDIRVQDYREIPEVQFDAISSIGMAEHVGRVAYAEYAAILFGHLRIGGRLLNHQIARRPGPPHSTGSAFIQRYVFPDGELAPIGSTVELLEEAGFEVRDVHAIREHYALTLREWVRHLDENWDDAVAMVGRGRARVWRAYMAASAVAFEANRIGVNQVLAIKTGSDGRSSMPLVRSF